MIIQFMTLPLTMLLFVSSAIAATSTFKVSLSNTSVVQGGAVNSSSTVTGAATFVLTRPDVGEPTLSYMIELSGADLDGAQSSDLNDDVTAIHLHDSNVCVASGCIAGDTAGTKHILNIFGLPREDDADMVFEATAGRVSGFWDAGDENMLSPAPSGKPGDFLNELLASPPELFLMVHTRGEPAGASGGFITLIPEPPTWVIVLAPLGWAFYTRKA